MPSAPLPEQEYARLLELARYNILDTAPEESFDRLTRLAARTLRVPGVILNFVDQGRQWRKSWFGDGETNCSREDSFCAWTILSDDVLAVSDAREDPRFHDYKLVVGDPNIRMYAGAPLVTPSGHRIGSLCVFSAEARELDLDDQATLRDLAALVMDELELRLHNHVLQSQINQQDQQLWELRQTVAHAQVLEDINGLTETATTPEEVTLAVAAKIGEAIHADWTGLIAFSGNDATIQVAHHQPDLSPALLAFASRLPQLPCGVTRGMRGVTHTAYIEDYRQHPDALQEGVDAGFKSAALVPLGQYGEIEFLLIAARAERGSRAAWRSSDRALLDAAGRTVRAALVRRAALEASLLAARQDRLTGIANRRAFDHDLELRMQAGQPFTFALMDLDGFKQVNDVEGHAQGDRVLQVFALALRDTVSSYGQVYRYGGDEFALLLDPLTDERALEHVDSAVLAARQVTTRFVGASVGIVQMGNEDNPYCPSELQQRADTRMYEVKRRRQAALN
ncbi:sensor domain-containing diguanylate cyclase [Deinococcus deserti]|uniref:Putative Diguanylate cyclase (GGDEF domain) with GAF sensor n=1 Tax=Deinococcus deserti (strain DSM 17065 / CIP 109153 / LMG 22923 / VCD115) TaxID=546414 RepID=C1D2J4_DEIDV|nr:sensor domain-containing diguanylate cyclase [Deinococcus deserti]ACO47633.1 putative Diguanylate cyclase (GGDEF domain) with GAF sensor [Deinococcus deserti VCD115]